MDQVQTYWLFITAGVGLVAAVIGAGMTQGFTRSRDERRKVAHTASLVRGIGQEYRLNLFEALGEMQQLILGPNGGLLDGLEPGSVLRNGHSVSMVPVEPFLQRSAMAALADLDHSAMAVMAFGYRELERHKGEIRVARDNGQLTYGKVQETVAEVIKGLALLYLWRTHYGKNPREVPGLRKRELLVYAKEQGLGRFSFPGLHLFDMFVEALRAFGLKVTPVPLKLPAGEYYARPPGDKDRVRREAERRQRQRDKEAARERAAAALAAADGDEQASGGRGAGLLDKLKGLVPGRSRSAGGDKPETVDTVD